MHPLRLLVLAVLVTGAHALLAPAGILAEETPRIVPAVPDERARYLFRITLHTPVEIEGLLTRAEQLAKARRPADRRAGIALVLHGPEIEIFARKNYSKYKSIVDRAARLDADGVIEVKMCQTEMRSRGIRTEDVPAFIEFVPYGPDEEERLQRRGYVYL